MTRFLTLLLLLSAVPFALVSRDAVADESYVVIVNPDLPFKTLDRTFLRDVFLKKVTRWPGDLAVRPVDLAPDAAARRKFTSDVLGRTVPAVKSYWQQLIFAGRDVPPPELDTPEKVVAYVQKNPGAIGYVPARADTSSVKVVGLE